jgi:undecaprenyl-diphosphatase
VLAWDKDLERWQVAHRAGFLNPIFEGLTYAGSYGLLWLGLGAVAALLVRRPQLFILTLVADGLGELTADVLKAAIPRARPHVHPLIAVPHSHSFPSGHATTSFACATVLALALPRWRVPLFLLAAAVAWSRVYVGVHYPLDVVAGAALGSAIGFVVFRVAQRSRRFGLVTQTDAPAEPARPDGRRRRAAR